MRLLVVVVAILGGVVSARAEDAAAAKRLFEEGRKLVEQGNTVEACMLFARSLEHERAPATLLDLGDCAEREGTPRKAWQLFDEAARAFERTGQAERARYARNRADAVLANYPDVAARLRDAPDPEARQERPAMPAPSIAAKTAPRSEPESNPRDKPPRRPRYLGVKIVAITSLGLSVIGGIVWAQATFGPIRAFEESDQTAPIYVDPEHDGTYEMLQGTVLTQEDCARPGIRDLPSPPTPNRNGLFDESCSAHARSRWAIPMTVGFSIVGVSALAYVLTRSDPDPQTVAITPSVAPDAVGATLHVAW